MYKLLISHVFSDNISWCKKWTVTHFRPSDTFNLLASRCQEKSSKHHWTAKFNKSIRIMDTCHWPHQACAILRHHRQKTSE